MDRTGKTLITLLTLTGMFVGGFLFNTFPKQEQTNLTQENASSALNLNIGSGDEILVPEDTVVSLFAVGDNLIHDVIYNQALARGGDTYDFSYAYEGVEELIPNYGLRFVNQETPLATALYPPSNYPLFNSPTEAGDQLVALGFNVVSQANNHMFDKWADGLVATMDYWATQPVTVVGVYPSEEEMTPVIIEENGLKIGFVGITDHTNGIVPQEDSMGYILSEERDEITTQVELLQEECDVVIVSAHWGDENTFEPSLAQQETANFLNELGVDLVLGHHSHTVQPLEILTNQEGKETIVVYSMGNFISAMADWYNMLGAAFSCDITKDGATGRVSIQNLHLTPLVTHYETGYRNLRVVTLADYTQEMSETHGILYSRNYLTPSYLTKTFEEIVSEQYR